jgi:hypothetical protein
VEIPPSPRGKIYRCPYLGRIEILAVRDIGPKDITDEIARSDGFDTARALRKELRRLYPPEARATRILILITFRYLGE